ncbi:MAG TPA: BTAD domain-containing putative transcriptional regulator, partial [Roseiflexaceae bacterium]|nr:BTAD domain-containing putative transcriptional regulator [Roseiflexaceae bacterium]
MRLGLHLFGQFQATWDGQPITFAASAARGVLAYLALDPDRPHQREQLAALLWPDMPQAAAYANLRQVLSRVRKALPEVPDAQACLEITPHTLEFKRAAATIDVIGFEELLAACAAHAHSDLAGCVVCTERLSEATTLYRGELLQGLFLAQPFEEWLLLKREKLHQQVLAALHALAEQHLAAQRWGDATVAAQRQIELERWREDAYRQLMRALVGGGDRAAALAVYGRCAQVLNDDLGIAPDDETAALAAAIRTGEVAEPARPQVALLHQALPSPLTPLVGRESELAQISGLLRDAATRLITLVGVGGAGKTRLALAAAWALREAFADGVGWVSLAGIAPTPDPVLQSDALAA